MNLLEAYRDATQSAWELERTPDAERVHERYLLWRERWTQIDATLQGLLYIVGWQAGIGLALQMLDELLAAPEPASEYAIYREILAKARGYYADPATTRLSALGGRGEPAIDAFGNALHEIESALQDVDGRSLRWADYCAQAFIAIAWGWGYCAWERDCPGQYAEFIRPLQYPRAFEREFKTSAARIDAQYAKLQEVGDRIETHLNLERSIGNGWAFPHSDFDAQERPEQESVAPIFHPDAVPAWFWDMLRDADRNAARFRRRLGTRQKDELQRIGFIAHEIFAHARYDYALEKATLLCAVSDIENWLVAWVEEDSVAWLEWLIQIDAYPYMERIEKNILHSIAQVYRDRFGEGLPNWIVLALDSLNEEEVAEMERVLALPPCITPLFTTHIGRDSS